MVEAAVPNADALREKYSRPRDELRAEAAAKPVAPSSAMTEQSNVIMCQECQASGIIKRQYGYRVIDEQCDTCNGEGMIYRNGCGPAGEELIAKVKRVEELIAVADDLDELDRLEAALKERSLKALDAALVFSYTKAAYGR